MCVMHPHILCSVYFHCQLQMLPILSLSATLNTDRNIRSMEKQCTTLLCGYILMVTCYSVQVVKSDFCNMQSHEGIHDWVKQDIQDTNEQDMHTSILSMIYKSGSCQQVDK